MSAPHRGIGARPGGRVLASDVPSDTAAETGVSIDDRGQPLSRGAAAWGAGRQRGLPQHRDARLRYDRDVVLDDVDFATVAAVGDPQATVIIPIN